LKKTSIGNKSHFAKSQVGFEEVNPQDDLGFLGDLGRKMIELREIPLIKQRK
jgi:hypothetical protein